MPQNATPTNLPALTASQVTALQSLMEGSSVKAAAEVAGVSREMVHRWKREDWTFQAALNRAQLLLQESVNTRLLAAASRAAGNLVSAIQDGDLRSSIAVLKGIGALPGTPLRIGSDEPEDLKEEAQIARDEARADRSIRSLIAPKTRF